MLTGKFKFFLLFLGDCLVFYAGLALTLFVRYKGNDFGISFNTHLKPFFIILIIFIIIFYISDLYSEKLLKHGPSTWKSFLSAILVNLIISVSAFYIFGEFFKLTPKTNLFLFFVFFTLFDYIWRFYFSKISIKKGWHEKILLIGSSPCIKSIDGYLKDNPQSGYSASALSSNWLSTIKENELNALIGKEKIDMLIIDAGIKKNPENIKMIYKLFTKGIRFIDSREFYESLFNKICLDETEENWFVENIITNNYALNVTKNIIDFVFSIFFIIILSPFIVIVALFVALTSRGPMIYKQERMGKNSKTFVLYKFRTMIVNNTGPLWTTKNDNRLTTIGKILRHSHLDELPQLFNILKGDISFTGPRPERIELAQIYDAIPYYAVRHTIKPGVSGWAQLYYKPSTSIEEAKEKLEYDLYYIKNRSIFLDFLIMFKTIKYVFMNYRKNN